MQKGELMRTPTGKIGKVVGFPCLNRPGSNGGRRVQLLVLCCTDDIGPVWIRASYDAGDLRPAERSSP